MNVEVQPYVPGQPSYITTPPTSIEKRRIRILGVVKRYWPDRGYGFICRLDSKDDVYFRRQNVSARGISLNQRVNFSIIESNRGYEAIDIRS